MINTKIVWQQHSFVYRVFLSIYQYYNMLVLLKKTQKLGLRQLARNDFALELGLQCLDIWIGCFISEDECELVNRILVWVKYCVKKVLIKIIQNLHHGGYLIVKGLEFHYFDGMNSVNFIFVFISQNKLIRYNTKIGSLIVRTFFKLDESVFVNLLLHRFPPINGKFVVKLALRYTIQSLLNNLKNVLVNQSFWTFNITFIHVLMIQDSLLN